MVNKKSRHIWIPHTFTMIESTNSIIFQSYTSKVMTWRATLHLRAKYHKALLEAPMQCKLTYFQMYIVSMTKITLWYHKNTSYCICKSIESAFDDTCLHFIYFCEWTNGCSDDDGGHFIFEKLFRTFLGLPAGDFCSLHLGMDMLQVQRRFDCFLFPIWGTLKFAEKEMSFRSKWLRADIFYWNESA